MSLKPETIAQLQTLIQADPALLVQLQSCTDAASSAAVIAKAAAAKGMDVSAPDVVAHFEAPATKQGGGAMSDAELEQIAGGGEGGAVFLSIISFGIGCAVRSIEAAALGQNCGEEMKTMAPF